MIALLPESLATFLRDAIRLQIGRLRNADREVPVEAQELLAAIELSASVSVRQGVDGAGAELDHPAMAPLLLTISEAARILKVEERTIHRRIASGQLKAVKEGRLTRIWPADLEAYARTLPAKSTRAVERSSSSSAESARDSGPQHEEHHHR